MVQKWQIIKKIDIHMVQKWYKIKKNRQTKTWLFQELVCPYIFCKLSIHFNFPIINKASDLTGSYRKTCIGKSMLTKRVSSYHKLTL